MKKVLILTVICCSILALPMLASTQKKVSSADKKIKIDWSKPIKAKDVKMAKKVVISNANKDAKGSWIISKNNKNGKKGKPVVEKAATGELGGLTAGNKYAVIIGICDYPGTGSDICDSDGDALNMYDALVDLYGYSTSSIFLFRDMATTTGVTPNKKIFYTSLPATFNNIQKAVVNIKGNATGTDEIVFFFSGHGTSGRIGGDDEAIDEGLVVHDGNNFEIIWDNHLKIWFNNFPTSRIIFIFDTCLAGGMNDVAKDGDIIVDGRIIVMSSKEKQSSYVYSKGEFGEGVFSRYFVNEGMLRGLADGHNKLGTEDNMVAIEEAFDYAKASIPLNFPFLERRQIPVISDEFSDDLLL